MLWLMGRGVAQCPLVLNEGKWSRGSPGKPSVEQGGSMTSDVKSV